MHHLRYEIYHIHNSHQKLDAICHFVGNYPDCHCDLFLADSDITLSSLAVIRSGPRDCTEASHILTLGFRHHHAHWQWFGPASPGRELSRPQRLPGTSLARWRCEARVCLALDVVVGLSQREKPTPTSRAGFCQLVTGDHGMSRLARAGSCPDPRHFMRDFPGTPLALMTMQSSGLPCPRCRCGSLPKGETHPDIQGRVLPVGHRGPWHVSRVISETALHRLTVCWENVLIGAMYRDLYHPELQGISLVLDDE